ncbi:MAG: hypothetical protein WA623_19750 [Candidatus Sulfotelmatobacter sp.]
MIFSLEYHRVVEKHSVKCTAHRSIPASLALFGVLLLPLLLVSKSPAQNKGHASSSSSHAASGAASTGHNRSVPANYGVTFSTKAPHSTNNPRNNGNSQHRPVNRGAYPYVYAVPVPYAVDPSGVAASGDDSEDSNDDADYQGGPSVFDSRGLGAASYVPLVSTSPEQGPPDQDTAAEPGSAASDNPDRQPPSDPTVLVFKDGHQLEVANYAIVNHTLYDLTPGHPRKIALADLDLPATRKQNDDRGIDFRLPLSAQAN